ncbi:UDP-2,3-diacylglucosamine diphosphatase [bacterium]|nr:UDP-2,3-diacylglucosamine diphosphatase [bacterium]
MRIIIISDTHIKFNENEEDRARRARVTSFLQNLPSDTKLLVLNGDIFDLWFDWNNVIIAGYYDFIHELKSVINRGIKVVMLAGNHDFWFNGFLERLGIEIYSDYFITIDQQKQIYITHGDKHTSNDLRYFIFRFLLRNSLTKFIFNLVHPELSLNIGKKLSRSSRDRQDSPEITKRKNQGLIDFAKKKINEGYHFVIMGHAHNPQKIKIDDGYYLNSGDWIVHDSYIEITAGQAELKYYNQ